MRMGMRMRPSQIPLFEELRGERVLVRPFRAEDADDHFTAVMESLDHVRPWLPWAAFYSTLDDSRDFIARAMARWILREDLIVGLWDAHTGEYVGGSGLHPRDWDVGVFEIGYWIRRSAEGRGYVTEAVRLQTDFAFTRLGANRVFIRCDARNTRSAAVPHRLGFVREALLRNDMRDPAGELRDTLMFALIPSDPRWPT
jgi:RimJ/RimL family protein N-acetyltransferase